MDSWINSEGFPVVTVKKLEDNNFQLDLSRFMLNKGKYFSVYRSDLVIVLKIFKQLHINIIINSERIGLYHFYISLVRAINQNWHGLVEQNLVCNIYLLFLLIDKIVLLLDQNLA